MLSKHTRVLIENPMSNIWVNMQMSSLDPSLKYNIVRSRDNNILRPSSNKDRNLQLIQALIRMSRIPRHHPRNNLIRLPGRPLGLKIPSPILMPLMQTSPPLLSQRLLLLRLAIKGLQGRSLHLLGRAPCIKHVKSQAGPCSMPSPTLGTVPTKMSGRTR